MHQSSSPRLANRYQVVRTLGAGAAATVLLCLDTLWDSPVALKLIHASSPVLRESLKTEFALLRELHHAALPRIQDFGVIASESSQHGNCYYTCDAIDGPNLGEAAAGIGWEATRRAFCDALEALATLHASGIRHGDFKPANIVVSSAGRGFLVDLGCARRLSAPREATLSGTLAYAAPELTEGSVLDHRTDLYAVGIALRDLLRIHRRKELSRLVDRLTRPTPDERPASADEVLEALGEEPSARPPWLARIGVLVGRGTALESWQRTLQALQSATALPRVVVVRGAEGSGRSRLLQEFKWEAQQSLMVCEGNGRAPQSILRGLRLFLGEEFDGGLTSIAVARERLIASEAKPRVLLIDDAHLLGEEGRRLVGAVARVLEATDPAALVLAARSSWQLPTQTCQQLELEPITHEQLSDWLAESLGKIPKQRLLERCGGHPGRIRRLLDVAKAEEWNLATRSEESLGLAVKNLSPEQKRTLALLRELPSGLEDKSREALAIDQAELQRLEGRGLVLREGACWRPAVVTEAPGTALAKTIQEQLARYWTAEAEHAAARSVERSEAQARAIRHWQACGEEKRAQSLLQSSTPLAEVAPGEWAETALRVVTEKSSVPVLLTASRLLCRAGRWTDAQHVITRAREAAVGAKAVSQVTIEYATLHLEKGDPAAAVKILEQQQELGARGKALLARCLNRIGDYAKARQLAEQALQKDASEQEQIDAFEAAGIAASYLGDLDAARSYLERAEQGMSGEPSGARALRLRVGRGLVEYRAGNLDGAAQSFRKALSTAEQRGLVEAIANAALNLGTACHQRGDAAEALSSYERGMRTAIALDQTSTANTLRLNLAKLYVDLGLFDRARILSTRCLEQARAAGGSWLETAAIAVLGEAEAFAGEVDAARGHFEQAEKAYRASGSARESVEVRIQLAELLLSQGENGSAQQSAEALEGEAQSTGAADVLARYRLLRARCALAKGEPLLAVPQAEETAKASETIGHRDLAAEALALQADAWERMASSTVAEGLRRRARELWERCAAGLEASVRTAFFAHPRRATLMTRPAVEVRAPATSDERRARMLERLLPIYRRLGSSLQVKEVLQRALDAAIELTEAERGLLLLVREENGERALQVAVARNLDKESVGKAHTKFSRAIAEQVVASGQPVITANALQDGRFRDQQSVHALRLQSVICVPACAPTGVVAVLYLDNRFARGRFSLQDIDLLQAFADQVAIALNNARLLDELQRRNRELEQERRRIEELARGQAEEIDRLSRQAVLAPQRSSLGHDYRAILGNSQALCETLGVIDRVVDTDVPVLLQGESGTGKELFARAIHNNGRRRDRTMVTLNCAAVPETLFESELFGHKRGAFTGADRDKEGLVQRASQSTLFLDEIGEMPLSMQVKLLRVLQEKEVQAIGAQAPTPVDFRLLCATNRTLRDEVRAGRFREDLYYRISVVEVRLPPLRERPEDIALLAERTLERLAREAGRQRPTLSRAALRSLLSYAWPGNVRQLENVLTKAFVLCAGEEIDTQDLELARPSARGAIPRDRASFRQQELDRIMGLLSEHRWNVTRVCAALGISRPTLYRKLRQAGIERQE